MLAAFNSSLQVVWFDPYVALEMLLQKNFLPLHVADHVLVRSPMLTSVTDTSDSGHPICPAVTPPKAALPPEEVVAQALRHNTDTIKMVFIIWFL